MAFATSASMMIATRGYTDFLVDIADLFFTWPANLPSSISRKQWRAFTNSHTWYQYECALISADICWALLAEEFTVKIDDIAQAWLQPNAPLLALLHELNAQPDHSIRIFGTFNVSAPDYDFFRNRADTDWSIFDHIFTSCAFGERMPEPCFFAHILQETNLALRPNATVFVSDDLDNIVAARSFGMQAVDLSDVKKASCALRNLAGDPVARAKAWLRANAGKLESVTTNGIVLTDNFTQLLILEATGDRSLVSIEEPERYWNFFQGQGILTTGANLPFYMDTTSLGLSVMKPPEEHIYSIMDDMLKHRSDAGIPWTYFDATKPRVDPVVVVNILHLFYSHGRGHELPAALEWAHQVLVHGAYVDGTRYYFPDAFLYFVARLLRATPDAALHALLAAPLRERIQERIGLSADALGIAMRVLTCASVGIADEVDTRLLLPLQKGDGGWGNGLFTRYPISGLPIGSRGWTTAMAIDAIEALEKVRMESL